MKKKCADFLLERGYIDENDEINLVDEMERLGLEPDIDANTKELCTLFLETHYKEEYRKGKFEYPFSIYLNFLSDPKSLILPKQSILQYKDITLSIAEYLDDRSLFNLCATDKSINNICKDETFWEKRTLEKFGGAQKFIEKTDPDLTWRQFYLYLVYYTDRYVTDYALVKAVENNIIDLVNYFISIGANSWNESLLAAAKNGNEELARLFLEKGAMHDGKALSKAAQSKNKNLVQMFSKLSHNWDEGFKGACKGGDISIVEFFISKGVSKNTLTQGIYFASKYNRKPLIDYLMETKGNNNWNMGLEGACRGGHKHLIDFFISKGAKNWEYALYESAKNKNLKNGNLKNVEFFYYSYIRSLADKGYLFTFFSNAIESAAQGGNMDVVKFLDLKSVEKQGLLPPWVYENALVKCMKRDNIEMMKYFIEKMGRIDKIGRFYLPGMKRYKSVKNFMRQRFAGYPLY